MCPRSAANELETVSSHFSGNHGSCLYGMNKIPLCQIEAVVVHFFMVEKLMPWASFVTSKP